MLRSVVVASATISLTTCCGVGGLPRCFPRASAARIPAVTRSLISDDSSSAIAPMMVNIARPMGLSVYGSPRVHAALRAEGRQIGRNRVARLMHHHGICARQKRRFCRTTDSSHDFPLAPNLLGRRFTASAPDGVWLADITYIPTAEGWLYLAVVLDMFSRRVVGWAMDERITQELTLNALRMAIATRRPRPGLLHHSDRGSQYAAHAYRRLLAGHGMRCSMSRKADCWDNAPMESFFGSMKTELDDASGYQTRQAARTGLFQFIEGFYNCASEHPSVYVTEEKRFCCSSCDPVGYFGFRRARSARNCAEDVARAARAKIQGPSSKGWMASIAPASAASRSVFGATFRILAALLRLSHGSIPFSAALNTGIR